MWVDKAFRHRYRKGYLKKNVISAAANNTFPVILYMQRT